MKKGLVMEGGAMRGMFTCGILDVFMENGIEFDGAIGTSAGATFGCNLKSRQIGRPARYNKNYCSNWRYGSMKSWFLTGDVFEPEFCYHTIPYELDPWDAKTFAENPMEFYCVCTDAKTARPIYHKLKDGGEEDIQWIRGSASIPVMCKPVFLGKRQLLDGGIVDPIALAYFQSIGYERNVVIETQPRNFVKKPQKGLGFIRLALHNYPAVAEALSRRHDLYNDEKAYIRSQEACGNVYVIRPEIALNISSTETDPAELERVYQEGRRMGLKTLEEVKVFLEENGNESIS